MSHPHAVWDASECALIFIDYQPEMFKSIRSSDPKIIELNACTLARAASNFDIPIILSTVGVEMGVNRPTIDSLLKEIHHADPIDRSSMNAWEDEHFVKAVKATGKKRLIFCGLWTEICLTFPVIDAICEDYEVAFIADAVGGMSKLEHDIAVSRLIQAGAVPNSTSAMICEWFRDWKSPLATKGREVLKPFWHLRHSHAEHDRASFQSIH